MASTLELVLLYLAAAIAGVVSFRMLRLPPVLGYLVAGVLIGPNALQLAHDTAGVRNLAEFGVVFLMFVIGLEFNLPKLRAMRTLVFGLGASQVVLTIAGAMAGNLLLVWLFSLLGRHWDLSWQASAVLGSAMVSALTSSVRSYAFRASGLRNARSAIRRRANSASRASRASPRCDFR